ncbi:retrovirus-related pol polyprotein from transposon TNT 1-94 [Tanacetum coccineum]
MLEKVLFVLRKKLELSMQNREHGRMIFKSVEHGNQQIHLANFPLTDSGLVVPVFKQGDDPIDEINKMMSFLSTVVTSYFPTTTNQLRNSSNPRQQATIHDGRVTVQPLQGRDKLHLLLVTWQDSAQSQRGKGMLHGLGIKFFWLKHKEMKVLNKRKGISWQTLELQKVQLHRRQAVLMANLSSYGSYVLSKAPHSENTHTNMLNQSVQEMSYSEQTHFVNYLENEISSDSNIIPYSSKRFVPQQELSDEQAFWLQTLHPNTDQSASSPVKIKAPRELPKCIELEAELIKQHTEVEKERIGTIRWPKQMLRMAFETTYKQLYDSIKPSRVRAKEHVESLVNQLNQKSVEITDLNTQLQEKVFVITAGNGYLRKGQKRSQNGQNRARNGKEPEKVNNDNLIANESLSVELERYKERVKLLEERQNVDFATREKLIIDDIIREKNAQFADFEKEINYLKQTLFEQSKEKELLTKTFKEKEAKNIDTEIALEKKVKELDNIVSKMAQQIRPMLYDGNVIAKETNVISISNSEETLMLKEESRSKMLLKQNFVKCFVPQQEPSDEQALHPNTDQYASSLVKIDASRELPKVSLVNTSLKKIKYHLGQFDNVVKKRITLDALIEGEWGYYLKHTMEQAAILREIVEEAKSLNPLDSASYFAYKYVKLIQVLLGYVRDTCTDIHKPSEKLVVVTPINMKKTVRHELCFLEFVSDMNARRTFTLVGNACPLTRITATNKVPFWEPIPLEVIAQESVVTKVYTRRLKVVQIVLWYLDSGCSKHMTRDRSQLTNFVRKFLGTVKFDNDQIAKIMGYDDYHIGNITISRVYYVEGLGHNLFSIGQFYDSYSEVAFRKHTCFVCNLEGVDLLSGSRETNLYTLLIRDMTASSPICLLSKASTKSWLWHQRLSHLNFGAINHLAKNVLVRGLPKLKFEKDHMCSACEMGKIKKQSHKPKSKDTNQEKLYLLHMDLCGPMHVASINGKKYILIIVDDYSRFTWVKFLSSKDEAPDFIINFLKMIQVRLNATVRNIHTDNGTEFVNQTLHSYYESVTARTMLIYVKAPLFLWAEAVVIACYTQDLSIIRLYHGKTTYELLHERKPDLSYLHVFGALCYPNNDSEDLGKLQAKADIGLVTNPIPQQPCNPPIRVDWNRLFQPMFDEYFNPPTIAVSLFPVAAVLRAVDLADSPVSTSINQDAPSISITSIQEQEHSIIISQAEYGSGGGTSDQ